MLFPRSQRPGGSWLLLLVASVGGWGCASEEIPRYGDPAQVAGGVGGGTGGETSTGGAGGSTVTECTPDPGCMVSFTTDIFPVLNDTAKCASAGLCHGNGGGDITIEATVDSYHSVLTALSIDTGKYIVPCDPAKSQILCNLKVNGAANPNGECGKLMPVLDQDALPSSQLQAIEDWIACGAPKN